MLLKTPTGHEAESEHRKSRGVSGTSGTLAQEMASGYIQKRLPTLLKTPSSVETEGGVMEIRPDCDGHYKLRDQIAMLPGTSRGLRLHSDFALWMMGYPLNWLDVYCETKTASKDSKRQGTPLSPKSRSRSSRRSQNSKKTLDNTNGSA
jgi:hypothetical protein